MALLTIPESIDLLRGLFHRYRYMRTLQGYGEIAQEMGLTKATLYRFGKGGSIQEESLKKIEAWCRKEEEDHATRVSSIP